MRYHLNPDRGVMPCRAKDPSRCRYSVEEHFDSRHEAEEAYCSRMRAEQGSFATHRNKDFEKVSLTKENEQKDIRSGFSGRVNVVKKNLDILDEVVKKDLCDARTARMMRRRMLSDFRLET